MTSWGNRCKQQSGEEFGKYMERMCQPSPLPFGASYLEFPTPPHAPSCAGWPKPCYLCRRSATALLALTLGLFICLSWMSDRLHEKQRKILWRKVVRKQQFPCVTCIFPPSVYFHCLQIYNSISLLLLLFRLLDSLSVCLGCFKSNKKFFSTYFFDFRFNLKPNPRKEISSAFFCTLSKHTRTGKCSFHYCV